MFNKRLVQELNETMPDIYKQVLCKWAALITNIFITFLMCDIFLKLIEESMNLTFFIHSLLLSVLLLCLRALVIKKANDYAFLSSHKVKTKLRIYLFDHVLKLGMQYQQHMTTAELLQLSVEGIHQLETYFGQYLPQLFYSLISPLTLFIIFSFYDAKVAFILLFCVPLIPLSIIAIQKFAKKLLAKYWDSYTTLGDSFLENLQGLTTLKIYQSDEYKQKMMNKEAEKFRKITMRVLIMQLNSISIMDMIAYGGAAIGSYFAIMHYLNHHISLFAAMIIVLLSFEFFIPLRQLGSFFHIAMNGIAASDKIFKLLDTPIEKNGQMILKENSFLIEAEYLSFAYQDSQNVLTDLNFTIKPHQWIGIIGESCSGKSTLAKLIMGYYLHYDGNLHIQNQPRRNINDDFFLKHFVYVSYDPIIFKGTVKENLCLKKNVSQKDIEKVLDQVHLLDDFLKQDGLDTILLENGDNLSGGQKQRLNIARALLYDAHVYIFDEASSNIDVESENTILKIVKELAKYKTVIMITHRLSQVIDCDNILVMEKGKIVEQGNHDQLIKNQQLYYHLLKQQEQLEVFQHA